MIRLSDIFIKSGLVKSRKDFKRHLLAGDMTLKGRIIEDDMVAIPTGTLTFGVPLGDDCYAVPPEFHNKSDDWLIIKLGEPV